MFGLVSWQEVTLRQVDRQWAFGWAGGAARSMTVGSSNVGLGPRKKGSPFARGSSVDVRAWRIFDLFQHCINRAVGYNDA